MGTAMTDSNGVATLPYTISEALGVGSININASFAGDTNYRKVNSNTAKLTVNKGKTAVTSANATAVRGVDKTLTATLKNATSGSLLSGKSVTFDITGIGTFTGTTDASGVASVTINVANTVATGKYSLTVSFAGDSLYLSTSKTGYTITVK